MFAFFKDLIYACSPWRHASVLVPPDPVWVPSQWPLASSQSAISKGDKEVKPGAVHSSPGIYLTEENSGKPHLVDPLMKAERPVIAPNGVLYL